MPHIEGVGIEMSMAQGIKEVLICLISGEGKTSIEIGEWIRRHIKL